MNIAFTGHRSDKLGGYDLDNRINKIIELKLYATIIKQTIKGEFNPPYHFITGGAIGADQIAANCVLEMKKRFSEGDITLEIAVPFERQCAMWNDKDVDRYYNQLDRADKVTYVDYLEEYSIKGYDRDVYYPAKMQMRNRYMVDKCDLLIAVWDGSESGGTYNCIKYARSKNKDIIIINPKEV